MNIKRFLGAVLFLLILLSLVGIQGATAQNGPALPMFTLSLEGYSNNTVPYEDEGVINIRLEVKNNDEETREAVVSMIHDLNIASIEEFQSPEAVEIGFNESEILTFTISLDDPLTMDIGKTRTIVFNVRPDNRTNAILTESTLVVRLESVPYYRFEIENVEASSNDDNFLEGNPLEVNFTGTYTGNVNTTLVAKLFFDKEEIDLESVEVSKLSKVDLVLEWNDPPSGEHVYKVVVYRDDEGELSELNKGEYELVVEEKYEIPFYIWVGAGFVIIIVFLVLTLFVRKNREGQINGNSISKEEPATEPAVVPLDEPIVGEKPVVEETPRATEKKKKGKKKKEKKKKTKVKQTT